MLTGSYVSLAQSLATAFGANYIPSNFATLTTAPNDTTIADAIYVFPAGNPNSFNSTFIQNNVIASAPHPAGPTNTDTNYSPLWQISLVYFQPEKARVLKFTKKIAEAQAAGDFLSGYRQVIPIIVECSVIFTPTGGQLPNTTIQRKVAN